MNPINKVILEWQVLGSPYSYQGFMTFTSEEFRSITDEDILSRQTAEYEAWLANINSLEQEQ